MMLEARCGWRWKGGGVAYAFAVIVSLVAQYGWFQARAYMIKCFMSCAIQAHVYVHSGSRHFAPHPRGVGAPGRSEGIAFQVPCH